MVAISRDQLTQKADFCFSITQMEANFSNIFTWALPSHLPLLFESNINNNTTTEYTAVEFLPKS